ncbi:MAG: prepilin-type N-terminal cleavage/methylation domain-containing protein [Sedimentisphaerales bacterium]|nr:prepilin-type N-terminal cleavage/methylation domain-containing protein [Sedimentisphaerales bacterium]
MSRRLGKYGFTLVEVLLAMAIIATIVSIVYGSYFVISQSVKTCKARTALSQQGQKVLGLLARQIRCSYVPAADSSQRPEKHTPEQRTTANKDAIDYFSGSSDASGAATLHFITTNAFSSKQNAAVGLFKVDYKLDGKTGALLLNQRPFVDTPGSTLENTWQPIAENIASIELEFFEGHQWLRRWNLKEQGQLPAAVRINITLEDENRREYHCGTVAYVYCGTNQGNARPDVLISADK